MITIRLIWLKSFSKLKIQPSSKNSPPPPQKKVPLFWIEKKVLKFWKHLFDINWTRVKPQTLRTCKNSKLVSLGGCPLFFFFLSFFLFLSLSHTLTQSFSLFLFLPVTISLSRQVIISFLQCSSLNLLRLTLFLQNSNCARQSDFFLSVAIGQWPTNYLSCCCCCCCSCSPFGSFPL